MKYNIQGHLYEEVLRHNEREDGEMNTNTRDLAGAQDHIMGSVCIPDQSERKPIRRGIKFGEGRWRKGEFQGPYQDLPWVGRTHRIGRFLVDWRGA